MAQSYYKLPLSSSNIIKNDTSETCSLEQSIKGFIRLITTSHFGEYDFDNSFGCTIWDIDFDNLTSTNKLRYSIANSISKTLTLHEKRISDITVDVNIIQDEFKKNKTANTVKKRVDIKVKSTIKQTNEPFRCLESFYIAPLAF